ncbi:hypothetical protein ACJIZ3_021256 [Penstemon smallii]|uniref:Uncharacterized protein n=1 Tax=Penstemon smallii TaxID=265156 RepID=A0ABD3SKX9_9LAMI
MPLIVCFGLWLASNPDNNECIHSLRWRLIPVVLVLLLVLLMGVFGALWNKEGLYSVCVFILSGCCKPPMACGFNYSNPTTWIAPSNITASVDCTIWNNDPTLLCYNCDSCKAGLLGSLRYEWKLVKFLQFNLIVKFLEFNLIVNVFSHYVLREF